MKIAIVGSGISGLVAAHLLHRDHDLYLFEANGYVGGHTNTVDVTEGSRQIPVDTGFIVYNPAHYPHFCRLLDQLGVEGQPTSMSFSVRDDRSGLEYNGTSVNRLFSQRANLVRPTFWRMIRDILRFNREARALLGQPADDLVNVADYVRREGYSQEFLEHYLVPLGSSLWSSPPHRFREFPVRFVIDFLDNHCMLQVEGRPSWWVIKGGSSQYVRRLIRPFEKRILLNCPVRRVKRNAAGVELRAGDERQQFDEVILAVHADQALRMVEGPEPVEEEILRAFPYQRNETVLHTDSRVLPRRKRAWASWNYRIPAETSRQVSVTYNMNMLQGLDSNETYCVSLNQTPEIEPLQTIRSFVYEHPLYTQQRSAAQSRHPEMIRRRGISYCGAYWGFGFHEDGVRSALTVCDAFGRRQG